MAPPDTTRQLPPGRLAGAVSCAILLAGVALAVFRAGPAAPEPAEQPERKWITLEEDDDVRRWVIEAAQAEQAGRWREALAFYRRALAKNTDHLCRLTDVTGPPRYASTAEYVTRRIARYPPEGLAAYRSEYEAPAQGLFEAWLKDRHPSRLEAIVHDYFFTTRGDEAAHLLATQLFDEGRCAEAAYYWDRILRYYPSPSVPPAVVAGRLLMARQLLRDAVPSEGLPAPPPGKAVRLAGVPADAGGLEDAIRRLPLTPEWIAGRRGRAAADPSADLPPDLFPPPQWLDRPDRSRPLRNDLRLWPPFAFAESPRGDSTQAARNLRAWQMAEGGGRLRSDPAYLPTVCREESGRDTILVQNGTRITALDAENGRLLWKNPPVDGSGADRRMSPMPSGYVLYGCIRDGRRVYANMYLPPSVRSAEAPAPAFGFRGDEALPAPRTIRCYDIPTGRLLWDAFGDTRLAAPAAAPGGGAGGARAKDPAREPPLQFLSPVAASGGRVYAAAVVRQNDYEIYVCALRADTGALLWKRFLCSAPTGGGFRGMMMETARVVPCVVESGGVVYCLTNLGAVAALHGANGSILWLAQYPSDTPEDGPPRSALRPASPPVLSGSKLVILPQDASKIFVFDAQTGAIEETGPAATDYQHLVGIHATGPQRRRTAIFAGKSVLFLLLDPPPAGERRDRNPPPLSVPVCARGSVAGNTLYLPTRRGLVRYDLSTLKILDAAPRAWVEESDAGNLVVAGPLLVSAGQDRVTAYADLERFTVREGAAMRQTPPYPPALLDHGTRLFESRRYEEAAAVLARAVALLEPSRPAEDPVLVAAREKICRSAAEQVEVLIGRGDPRRLNEALEILRRAAPHARREELRAELFLLTARAHLTLDVGRADGKPSPRGIAAALLAFQETLECVPGAMAPARAAGDVPGAPEDVATRRVAAGPLAAEMMAALIEVYGREGYQPIEERARQALAEAVPPGVPADPAAAAKRQEALAAVVGRFPHSEAAWEAAQRRAALAPAGAAAAVDHYLSAGWPDAARRVQALLAFADAPGLAGDPNRRRRVLEQIHRAAAAFPDVRAAAAGRLAALPPMAESPVPANRLDLSAVDGAAACREDLVPAGDGRARRVLVPEVLPGGAPDPLPANRILLARGSSIALWDLDARAPAWSLSCPKGDPGFDLADDPAKGVKDAVFIFPNAAGAPARNAKLQDGDVLERIDGIPVTAAAARRILAGCRTGVPLRLEVRRSGQPVALTLEPGPWPEDREPFVLPEQGAWLPGGAVAVAWKTFVAAVVPGEASARWVFPPPGAERIAVEVVQASRRRIFVRYTTGATGAAASDEEVQMRLLNRRMMRVMRTTVSGSAKGPEPRLACLDAGTGQLLWDRVYPAGCLFDPQLPDLVFADDDLIARTCAVFTPAASNPNDDSDEENLRQQNVVEVIDGRTGRRVGPGAAWRTDAAVEAMAMDRQAGWLVYHRGGQDVHAYDLLARADRSAPLRLAQDARGRNNNNSGGPAVALAAAWGRVAVATHQSDTVEVGEPGSEDAVRPLKLSALLGSETGRQVDAMTPGALLFDGPGRLLIYSTARQQGYLTCVDLAAPGAEGAVAAKRRWDTVGTPHRMTNDRGQEASSVSILPPTARYYFKVDRVEGSVCCFDKQRDGSHSRRIAAQRPLRAIVRGEQLIVEAGGEIKVFRK